MLEYFKLGISGDKKAFVLFDLFECSLCLGLFKMVPFFQPLFQMYTQLKRQIVDPIDGLIIQCQTYLKCLPRPISQLAGYPIIFYFFCTYLINSFRDFIIIQDEVEDLLFIHLIIIGFVGATYLLTYFISPGYFDTKEDKEELERALLSKPELKNNHRIVCNECQFPKVARSFHCAFCNKCIAKTEYHSSIFTKCIGAGNHPYYYLFLIGITALFGFQSYLLGSNRIIKGKKYGLLPLLLNFRIFLYYFLLTCQHTVHIFSNLTYKEIHEARKLPYLWKTLKCDYFNPFDKGVLGNLREFILVLTTRKSIPFSQQELKKYQNIGDEERSQIIDKTNQSSAAEHSDSSDSEEEEESKHNTEEQQDEFDEIGKEKPIPDKYINWISKKFYTIIDIHNSPIRDLAIMEMRKKLRKEKKLTQANPEFYVQNQLRMNEQKMMRGQMTSEEMEKQKNELIEKMNQERQAYMQKQLNIQKVEYEKNPEKAKQAKLYMEMGFTNAQLAMIENPQRAADIGADLKMAEKNYIFLFGEDAFQEFKNSLTNPQLLEEQLKSYTVVHPQQQQQQEVKQIPKHVYQPEQPNFMQQHYQPSN